jgi:hypothetical protein
MVQPVRSEMRVGPQTSGNQTFNVDHAHVKNHRPLFVLPLHLCVLILVAGFFLAGLLHSPNDDVLKFFYVHFTIAREATSNRTTTSYRRTWIHQTIDAVRPGQDPRAL